MANIPARVEARLQNGIKRFQPVLISAKNRDVNESDTVIIVTDMLQEVFGYDKYAEITSEHAIRGTYCDLATTLDGKIQFLIEVKAIGLELKDSYIKQAIDYAANKGVEWVILTNGQFWRVYKVTFSKPIDQELVFEFDFFTADAKNGQHLEILHTVSKEGWLKQVLGELHQQRQVLSKFMIAAVCQSDPVVDVIRRELRRLCSDVKIQSEQIRQVLFADVFKREVVEGDKALEAQRKIARSAGKVLRARNEKEREVLEVAPCAPPEVLITSQPTTSTAPAAPPS
jgi:predicted type IV restriction endonuclease